MARYNIEQVIKELNSIKGSMDRVYIDTVDALEKMKNIELSNSWYDFLREEDYDLNSLTNDNIVDILEEKGLIRYGYRYDTFHYGDYLTNDMVFDVYSKKDGKGYIAKMTVCVWSSASDYSSTILLEFKNREELLRLVNQSKCIDIELEDKKFIATIHALSDRVLIETVNNDGTVEEFGWACGEYQDIVDSIREPKHLIKA